MMTKSGVARVVLVRILQYSGLLALAFVLFPSQWGGFFQTTVVSGTSMLPTYESHDIVIAFKTSSYTVGDVIVYHPEELDCERCNVVHRVVKIESDGTFRTKGDNNPNIDVWHPTSSDVYGKVIQKIHIGAVGVILLSPSMWIFFLCTVGVFWLLIYIRETLSVERARANEDKEE